MKTVRLGFVAIVGMLFVMGALAPAQAVLGGPNAKISSPADGCLYETGQSIFFDASLSTGSPYYNYTLPITLFKWTFGDNTTATGAQVNHSFSKAGKYTVTLTVTDSSQTSASTTVAVNIAPPARPQEISSQPMNQGVYFNPVLGGGILLLNAGPTAVISEPVNNVLLNINSSVKFDGSRSTGSGGGQNGSYLTSYKWSWGDGTQDGTGYLSYHIFMKMGMFTVTLTVADSWQQTATSSILVFTSPAPAPQELPSQPMAGGVYFNPVLGGMTVCQNGGATATITSPSTNSLFETGRNIMFDGSRSVGSGQYNYSYPISSYKWTFGDGGSATGAFVNYSYVKGGVFLVTLTITDYSQATASSSINIAIAPPAKPQELPSQPMSNGISFNPILGGMVLATGGGPNALITGPADRSFFETGVDITFDGRNSTGNNYSYLKSWQWTFGDGGSASGYLVHHTYSKGGAFTVTLTVTDYYDQTGSVTIKIYIAPPASPQNPPSQSSGPCGFYPVLGGMFIL